MTDKVSMALNAYEAGFVQRYHTHPRLARFGQTDGHHSFGVAALMINLHPAPSAELLKACITHDMGERFAGDLPAPVKRDNPELAEEHRALEALMLKRYFFDAYPDLSEHDEAWLKAVDMLECHMFLSLTIPEALAKPAWVNLRRAILYRFAVLRKTPTIPTPVINVAELMDLTMYREGFDEPTAKGDYQ